MKTMLKKLFAIGIPLTVLVFCLVTVQATNICDGDRFTSYGFPFVWTMPGATSLAPATDMIMFATDLGAYFALFAALSATRLFERLITGKAALIAPALWLAAFVVGGWFCIVMFYFGHDDGRWVNDCVQTDYRPHFGFPAGR